jgi:hypothetical protein
MSDPFEAFDAESRSLLAAAGLGVPADLLAGVLSEARALRRATHLLAPAALGSARALERLQPCCLFQLAASGLIAALSPARLSRAGHHVAAHGPGA